MRLSTAVLVLSTLAAAACEPTSLQIGYDPVGTWEAMERAPNHGPGDGEVTPRCAEVQEALGGSFAITGDFPEFNAEGNPGTLEIAGMELDVDLVHNTGMGASVDVSWLGRQEIEVGEGRVLEYIDFYSSREARVLVTMPDYCWTWFELQ